MITVEPVPAKPARHAGVSLCSVCMQPGDLVRVTLSPTLGMTLCPACRADLHRATGNAGEPTWIVEPFGTGLTQHRIERGPVRVVVRSGYEDHQALAQLDYVRERAATIRYSWFGGMPGREAEAVEEAKAAVLGWAREIGAVAVTTPPATTERGPSKEWRRNGTNGWLLLLGCDEVFATVTLTRQGRVRWGVYAENEAGDKEVTLRTGAVEASGAEAIDAAKVLAESAAADLLRAGLARLGGGR